MRLGYVGSANAHEHSAAWWAKNRQDPDRALHLVRTWAWSPWLQECQQRLGHALHERTPLPNTWKELAIVRVCGRVSSGYEMYHHLPLARATGLDESIISVALDPAMRGLDALDTPWPTLLTLADALDDGAHLSSQQWADVTSIMTPDQLVAFNAVVGYWRTNAHLALACELDEEPWMHPATDTRPVDPDAPGGAPRGDAPGSWLALDALEARALSQRAHDWLGRSDDHVRSLAAMWSWVEDLQVANQRWWQCLTGPDVELPPDLRGWVARRACERVGAPTMATIVGRVFPEMREGPDADVATLVERWESAHPIDGDLADRLQHRLGRRQIVEVQLVLGFVGAQARLANLMDGPQ